MDEFDVFCSFLGIFHVDVTCKIYGGRNPFLSKFSSVCHRIGIDTKSTIPKPS